MDPLKSPFLLFSTLVLVFLNVPVNGQIIPCTPAMLSSFTPCMNFVANRTANGSALAPTSDCCNSLKSLTTSGLGCACLIVNGNIPFQIPINRTLAISLPRACNMPGIPLQCKASVAPAPSPGPAALGPNLPPGSAPTISPEAPSVSKPTPPSQAPPSGTTPQPQSTPPSSSMKNGSGTPSSTAGSRPALTPSAAPSSYNVSIALVLFALGSVVFNYY